METAQKYHAIKVDEQKCFGCTHCMKACPTEAIRIVNGVASIRPERCVDCGNCLRACPAKAFYVEQDDLLNIFDYNYRVALFPSVLIGQFPEKHSEDQIYQAILELGFTHIYEVEQPIRWLSEEIKKKTGRNREHPVISSFCPAVVRLIQSKYPSLAENIIPLKAPHDLAANFAIVELKAKGANEDEIGIFYISPCSAKMAAVNQPLGEKKSVVNGTINMKDLYNRIMKIISKGKTEDFSPLRKNLSRDGILWSLPRGESKQFKSRAMSIDGIHNVVKFLERLENEEITGLDYLELKSCSQGCAGGILLTGNRFLTSERLQKRALRYPSASKTEVPDVGKTIVQKKLQADKIEAKSVFVLHEDRVKALDRMQKAGKILCQLPGIDCGACGAPNCHALAEDMVQGNAKMTDCIFLQKRYINENKLSVEKGFKSLEKIWGQKRFDADCNKKGGRNEGF
ncbi:4Fe-4S dicluster domain-containing protein [Maribellus comscasis]|uniref:4Fe-4S dicluster domain-containing protein n=1 Tax=Maribellus comscasis TaxID=2681766 RepID=A0A6I6JT77_9BACT|nr:[Fe-Fe] hydrogenase large subunit C-terminal domain-containing protein [Maribellus comscasis]QGY45671.1 4Fe-4S dicluster domain-containing protein [Maribellus comscasis]